MSETTIENAGSCIATAQAIEAPGRIRWMLRTPSAVPTDSGWRFYADEDDEDNMAHTTNMRVVDLARIAALEPLVAEVYTAPVGSDFEIRTLADGSKQVVDSGTGAVVAGSGAQAGSASAHDAAGSPAADASPSDGSAAVGSTPGGWPGAADAAGDDSPADGSAPLASAQGQEEAPAATQGGSVPAVAPGAAATGAGNSGTATSGTTGGAASAAQPDLNADPAAQDAAVAAGAAWLRPAVQRFSAAPGPHTRTALLSELFGAPVLVPFEHGVPAAFSHTGRHVVPVHTSRQGAQTWQQRLGAHGRELRVLTGDEALRSAFAAGAQAVVIDPVEVGVEIASDDEFLAGYSRNGELKRLVRSGDKDALLAYLVSEGATGVYLYDAQPGQPAYPMLVTRQGSGEREFALFSSALEVFRYQGSGSAAEISLDWVRANLAQDMYLCIDPGAEGGFVEFSPADLAAVGFRRN